jgi:uncharacterized membrane-anchored protein YitT (DUF2179 family)
MKSKKKQSLKDLDWETIQPHLRDFVWIFLGVLSACLGLKGFLLPVHFLDGGVTGISLLLNKMYGFDLSILIIIINIPFILMGVRQVSKVFALKTMSAIVLLSILLALIDFPIGVTKDPLLIAVFGGFFIGMGVGLCMRGGGVLDGTEVLAIWVSRRLPISVGGVVLSLNIIIFGISYIEFGIEVVLYSILTYFTAGRMIDFVVTGIEEYVGVMIISKKNDEIREHITQNMGIGLTILKGKAGYSKHLERDTDIDIIYTVVTRLEIQRLMNEAYEIDENAFITQTSINDTHGGMIKKRKGIH